MGNIMIATTNRIRCAHSARGGWEFLAFRQNVTIDLIGQIPVFPQRVYKSPPRSLPPQLIQEVIGAHA